MHHVTRPSIPPARRFRRAGVLLAATVLLASACGGSDDVGGSDETEPDTVDTAAVLGEKDEAAGEPVVIGFVSDGRGPAIDNSHQVVAAEGMVEYLNDYRSGIAGRPIELVSCETQFEPGKATECANELVQAGAAAVLMPESSAALAVHTVMKENGIPIFVYGVGDSTLLLDTHVTFALADPIAGLSDSPIGVAKDNDLAKVTAVVVDVPAATAFYQSIAPGVFEEAGIELEVVAIPPDQADLTPQMTKIANGDPTVVHIVGHDTFCIAAINGLASSAFDGPISMLALGCQSEALQTSLGDKLEGVHISSSSASGDLEEEGIQLWTAIVDEYDLDVDVNKGLTTFSTAMALRLGLDALTGEVTPETIDAAIRSAPSTPLPGAGGLEFRCNGKARAIMPAVCTNGNLRAQLDADGEPVLPWTLDGGGPIPD